MKSIKTWQWLGFAGLLPFIILSVLAFNHSLLAPEHTMLGFVSYSAVILSFVAGTLWGKAVILTLDDNIAKLLIISNIKQLSTTTSYLTLRTILTSAAVVCHIIVMLSLFSV